MMELETDSSDHRNFIVALVGVDIESRISSTIQIDGVITFTAFEIGR